MFSVTLILLLAAGSCVNSIDLIQTDSIAVQPGQSLTITCQVSGYSLTDNNYATGWIRQCEDKQLTWILNRWGGGSVYQNDALKNKFLHHTHTSTSSVTLTGLNMRQEDTAVYYCVRGSSVAGYLAGFDYWGKGTQVTVVSATSTKPTVFPLMQCGSGDTITLGCLATGFMPSSLTYAWSKNGAALTDFIQYPPVLKGNVYTGVSQIRVKRQDLDPREPLQCSVKHEAGDAEVIFAIKQVTYELPTIRVLASSDEEREASFSCFAKDFSPKEYQLKWLKNDEDISNKIYEVKTPSQERKDVNGTTLYSAGSFLMVKSSEWTQDSKFTCQFEGKGENGATFVNSSVTYKHTDIIPCEGCPLTDADIQIIGPTMEDMFFKKKGKIVCQVQENNPSLGKIWWEDKNGNEMVGSTVTVVKGQISSLSLDITYDEWSQGIQRYCVVEHTAWIEPEKKLYERNIGGQLQRPSVFMLPPVEHTRKEMVTLTCYVKDFFPHEVFVSWFVDDEEADSNYDFHTTNPVKTGGSYSAYGQLLLSLEQWKKNDVVYSCVVHHESVATTTKAIVRSIGYRMFDKTNLVNLNMNVPDKCKAQ